MTIIPRFQGVAIEKDGGWTFELNVSLLGDEEGTLYVSNEIYKTKEEAIEKVRKAIQSAIKGIIKDNPELGWNTDNYIDLKTNSTRRWDKKDEQ